MESVERSRFPGQTEYRFRHAIVRDTAYALLRKRIKRVNFDASASVSDHRCSEMCWISTTERVEIHGAAINSGLSRSRNALLAGIDLALVARIPREENDSAQLMADLSALARERAAGPLTTWLENAKALVSEEVPAWTVFDVIAKRIAVLRPIAPTAVERAFAGARRLPWRSTPLVLLVLTLASAVLGRTSRGHPERVVVIEINESTDHDLPGSPPFSAQPIPLNRVADLLKRITAQKPKAIALAIDLGTERRTDEDFHDLMTAIQDAQARGVRVVLPAGAAPGLAEVAREGLPKADHETEEFETGTTLLWQPLDGAPIGTPLPLALRLVAAEPRELATTALLPWNVDAAVARVESIPAQVAASSGSPTLTDDYVVLGGLISSGREGDAGLPITIYRPPFGRTQVTSASGHAIIAACAAGGDLRWRLPWWPWLLGGLAALLTRLLLGRRVGPRERGIVPKSIELMLGISSMAVVVLTSYSVPTWPLFITAIAGMALQRLGADDAAVDGGCAGCARD